MILDGLRKDSTMRIAEKVASGSMSFHMSSGGYGLSHPIPQDIHPSFLSMGQKESSM
jgi:hypothetical protein